MSKSGKGPVRFAWKSACTTCKAIFQWCYSAFVLILVAVTLFTAYVSTLDDIPVPSFIIRELQDKLKSEGLSLRMEGVRFQPNGRVTFSKPELYSPEFGSTLFAAEKAVAKIKLTHLLFGAATVDEIRLSAGRLILPAMLTPSGEPTVAVSSLNLEATHRGQRWAIDYANCAIDNLKLSLAGTVNSSLLKLPAPQPDAAKLSATQIILDLAPKIARLKEELKRFEAPFAIANLDVIAKRQVATLEIGARQLRVTPEIRIHSLRIHADLAPDQSIALALEAGKAELPQNLSTGDLRLSANWDSLPSKLQPDPYRIHASVTNLSYQDTTLPSFLLAATPHNSYYRAQLHTTIPASPVAIDLTHFKESRKTDISFEGQIDSETLAFLAPLAQKLASIELNTLAQLDAAVDWAGTLALDPEFKPASAEVHAQSGPASLAGATIDYAASHATLAGPQIDVTEIQLRSGMQSGVITIGYNLETLLRRILVEGSFDPTMINDWFKPWWAAMWDGMTFPDEGMLTYLDSQATFKRPDTVRVTGIGYVRDLDLRGMEVHELRTRIFSLFHYVDLYDLELSAEQGQQAVGEVQFHMDRDVRDEKDKLTGIWIQAISTLDVKNAPNLLWEIVDETAKILQPYCYHIPPLIEARSASVRRLDEYINDIDLEIETYTPFAYYGFPFDSLETYVHIGDDVVDIPLATATLGGGAIEASIFVVGDELDLALDVDKAGFGETLDAANTYFAKDGSETAQQMDSDRLLNYGGSVEASFSGSGIAGDATSFVGDGEFDITDADFGKFQMFGLLSMALEITPLRFTTLKFTQASGPFTVDHSLVRFEENRIEGPVALIEATGNYNIETDALDFSAKLFPFRNSKVPLISPIINIPLNIVSNVFEVSVTGTFDEPQLRLFNPSTKEQINVAPNRNPRDARPATPRSR